MAGLSLDMGSVFAVVLDRCALGLLRQRCSVTLEMGSALRFALASLVAEIPVTPCPTMVAAHSEFVPEGLRFLVFLGNTLNIENGLLSLAAASKFQDRLERHFEQFVNPEDRHILRSGITVRPVNNALTVHD